jgi:hypothetical protein
MSSNSKRVAGVIFVKVNGAQMQARGNFKYNLGKNKKEGVVGADGVHGYSEKPQIPFVEGEITDSGDLDLEALVGIDDATCTLELANGKTIVISDGWYAGEGTGETEEGKVDFRFEGMSGDQVR